MRASRGEPLWRFNSDAAMVVVNLLLGFCFPLTRLLGIRLGYETVRGKDDGSIQQTQSNHGPLSLEYRKSQVGKNTEPIEAEPVISIPYSKISIPYSTSYWPIDLLVILMLLCLDGRIRRIPGGRGEGHT